MSAVCWTEAVTPERQSTTVPKVSNSTACTRAILVTARCGPYGVIGIPPLGGLADARTPVPDFQLTVAGGAVGRRASRRRRGNRSTKAAGCSSATQWPGDHSLGGDPRMDEGRAQLDPDPTSQGEMADIGGLDTVVTSATEMC